MKVVVAAAAAAAGAGEEAASWAVEAAAEAGAEAVRVLIAYGAHTQHPPEGADMGRDWHGLVDVARRGYVDTADALCSDPTLNLDWANNLGETPLLTAARLGHALPSGHAHVGAAARVVYGSGTFVTIFFINL